MLFRQVAGLADRRLIGHRLETHIDADESTQCAVILKGLLSTGIGQVEPILQELDAQHALDVQRPAPSALRIGIERLDAGGQLLPVVDALHLVESLILAGHPAKLIEAFISQCFLGHVPGSPQPFPLFALSFIVQNIQTFLPVNAMPATTNAGYIACISESMLARTEI